MTDNGVAIDGVPITHHVTRHIGPGERVRDLPRDPFRGGVARDSERENVPSMMTENHLSVEKPEIYRRHD